MDKVLLDLATIATMAHVIEMNTDGLKNSNWNEHSGLKDILG